MRARGQAKKFCLPACMESLRLMWLNSEYNGIIQMDAVCTGFGLSSGIQEVV